MLNNRFVLINIIDRIKLPFRKEKELYSSLYHIIGFYPHNIDIYKTALLHKSVMHRNKKGKPVNNERLEFLGDAVLDCAVGDIVFRHFPGKREGFLTNTRSKLVKRETLNKLASEMGISNLVLSSGRSTTHNSYLGGNAFEALVGALYLDRGYDACMAFLKKRILKKMINIDKVAYREVNFKSKLIEWTQKNKVKMEFKSVSCVKDKDGNQKFCYQVQLEGVAGCSGKGYTKKESQQNAAKDTLAKLKREPQFIDAVFNAKAERTKMEEEPVIDIPDTSESQNFIIAQDNAEDDKHETTFIERVYSEDESAVDERREAVREQPMSKDGQADKAGGEDVSANAQSKEEIIAAAENAAFEAGEEETD